MFTFDSGQILRLLISMEFLSLRCRQPSLRNVPTSASMDGCFYRPENLLVLDDLKGVFSIFSFINQQLSQEAYNTTDNRPHSVMANEIRAEVSVVNLCLTVFVHQHQ